ncbi:hypothetical protein XM25_19897 [Devosia sp. H5989]|nr:hypothetical protein XM25_19897 [Devosia sp. H5989]
MVARGACNLSLKALVGGFTRRCAYPGTLLNERPFNPDDRHPLHNIEGRIPLPIIRATKAIPDDCSRRAAIGKSSVIHTAHAVRQGNLVTSEAGPKRVNECLCFTRMVEMGLVEDQIGNAIE